MQPPPQYGRAGNAVSFKRSHAPLGAQQMNSGYYDTRCHSTIQSFSRRVLAMLSSPTFGAMAHFLVKIKTVSEEMEL
jgi:hypothetical protein